MKQAIFLIMCLCILSLFGCAASSGRKFDVDSIKSYRNVPGVTQKEIMEIEALISENKSFTYGQMLETEAFLLSDGAYAGFATQFCELLSTLFETEFILEFYKWDELKKGLDQMSIDFTGDLTPTAERMETYHMSYPIAERSFNIFTMADSEKIERESALKGLRAGFLTNSVTADTIMKWYPGLTLTHISVDSFHSAVEMLQDGEIDLFVGEGVIDPFFDEYSFIRSEKAFPLAHSPVSLSTANPDLAPIISVVNKYLSAGGIDKLFGMYKKGDYDYVKYKLSKSLNDKERAYLDDLAERQAKVSLALEHDNYPISFYNEKERAFEGIALEVLSEISALTDIEFQTVTNKDTPWTEVLEKLKTGEISIVTELLYTESRKDDYIWSSEPYVTSYYALLSRVDFPDLANYQVVHSGVGTIRSYGHEDIYHEMFPNSSNTIVYETLDEAFDALENGEIDLLMASEFTLLRQTNYNEQTGFKVNIRFSVPAESTFGYGKDEDVLRSIIDKAQSYVQTEHISRGWTGRMFDYSRKYANERSVYLAFFTLALFSVVLIVITLFIKNKGLSSELEKQTATLSTIYRSIPDMVFCKDTNHAYTSCNASYEKFAGKPESEIVGKTAYDLFERNMDMARGFFEADRRVLNENAMSAVEEWFVFPDGSRKLMETIKTPLVQNGITVGLLGISRDITEHIAVAEEAKAASRAKSMFLAHMSHEIRTPMNAIVGMTELILREDIPPAIYENTLGIKHASANLLSIINDILDFSKIEAGRLEIITEEYSFVSLINDVLSIIRMKITEKPLLLAANIDCNTPGTLIGDEARIRQILLNLLGNAVKYTQEGFVAVAVSCEIDADSALLTITVSDSGVGIKEENLGKLFDDFIQIGGSKGIQGTGLGLAITKELCLAMGGDIRVHSEYGAGSTFTVTLPQKINVYEKFTEVNYPEQKSVLLYEPRSVYADSIARSLDNLGVSHTLTSTQSEFSEELGKKQYQFIFVSSFLYSNVSRLLKNVKFSSVLVLMTEFGEAAPAQNIRTLTMPAYSFSIANILNDITDNAGYNAISETNILFMAPTARVLIVDDVSTNIKVAEGLMTPYKMQIDTCKSGAEALKLAARNRYDIIFMDHMMPEIDGVEAAARIRSMVDDDGYFKSVPIIALTANAVAGMREMFHQNGFNDFLAKPIEIIKLNNILEKWIPSKKREKFTEAKTTPQPFTLTIQGIDVKEGLSMTGGSIEHYLKTLEIFCQDGQDKITEITDALNNKDIKLYTIYVHALKSAAASIGARQLSDLARTLEIAGKSEAVTFIRENTDDLLNQLKVLLENIKAALPNEQSDGDVMSADDIELLKNKLGKLKSALALMDVREMDAIISQLEQKHWEAEISRAIGNLSGLMLMFENDEALNLIDRLIERLACE